MKKILYIIVVVLITLFIYIIKKDNKIQYLVLGQTLSTDVNESILNILRENNKYEKSILEFQKDDKRIIEILNDIKENKTVNNISINNALVKSELIIININYMNNKNLEENLDLLIKTIKHITKEKIVLIAYSDIYIKVSKLNNIKYVDNKDDLLSYIQNDIIK